MALPGAFELLNSISQSNTIHCITQGECNYQHTKAMLTDIEQKVESVLVTYDKSIQLKSFIENKGYLHKEAVIIGDSQSDIVAGREAGIDTVCVKSEKYDPEKFDVKADLVVEDLKELLDLLNSQIDL